MSDKELAALNTNEADNAITRREIALLRADHSRGLIGDVAFDLRLKMLVAELLPEQAKGE